MLRASLSINSLTRYAVTQKKHWSLKAKSMFRLQNPIEQQNTKLIFIHIPKAAGSSFRESLKTAIGASRVGWIGPRYSLEDLPAYEFEHGQTFDLIGGHAPVSKYMRYYRENCQYFATLREPVSRVISLHSHIARRPEHHLHNELMEMTFLEACEQHVGFRSQIHNLQCAYLSETRVRTFAAAVDSILKNRIYLNTMNFRGELLSTAMEILEITEQIDDRIVAVTATPKGEKNQFDYRCEKALKIVGELNQEDRQLFNTIEDIYQNISSKGRLSFEEMLKVLATKV